MQVMGNIFTGLFVRSELEQSSCILNDKIYVWHKKERPFLAQTAS